MRGSQWILVTAALASSSLPARAADWPQFRGPQSSGVATSEDKLPTEIGPDRHVIWKTALPPGHSSPIVVGERIFLQAFDKDKLLTVGLDRKSGKVLWQQEAPHSKLEAIHNIGSYAQCTPAADAERVVAFFGSSGLYCYTHDGKLLWKRPMGPFNNDFGAATSPILVDNLVILCQDHDTDSFLMALDKQTGEMVWTADRSEFTRNYCTPILWDNNGKKQIVIAASLRVVGYELATGREAWTVRGIARFVSTTPVVGNDGNLYLAGWAMGGDAEALIRLDPYEQAASQWDKNGDGSFSREELPKGGPVEMRYPQIDRDKNGLITKQEYDFFRNLFEEGKNVVMAIKPGCEGEATEGHTLWRYEKFVPFCSSPVYYKGLVFTIKDGGILNCLDAKTGKPTKQGRLPNTKSYYSSPTAGDGKIYLLNQEGQLSVVSAEREWEVLHEVDFGEDGYASPAIVDGKIYLRTGGHLYCFGLEGGKQ